MLTELSIRNFAIIDDISITFYEGLTIMTGETGAGKSIIIDAVQLLTGARGSVDFVRHGEKKAEITGLFYIHENQHQLTQLSAVYDVELQDGTLVLERSITAKGRSICKINGKIVPLSVLSQFGELLVSIHSQHDTIHLMDVNNHLRLLDQFNAAEINPVKAVYHERFQKLQSLRKEYQELAANEQQTIQRIDLLKFQLNEINQAALAENEDDELEQERNQLHNFEKIFRAVNESYYLLHGEDRVLEQLTMAKDSLTEAADADKTIEQNASELTSLYYQLEEISFSLRDYQEGMHFDENRLNEIEMRLHELNRLKKKYGTSVNEILQYRDKISVELSRLHNKDDHIEQLEKSIEAQKQYAMQTAEELHKLRKTSAAVLKTSIMEELHDLYLPNASFSVDIKRTGTLKDNGMDHIEFMLSTNIGEPLKSLSKTASGGELSRIMLAIHKIFAAHDEVSTIIFDEIDTGVSGRVAQAIAEKMYQIALSTQVLGITHLSQVAAMSDNHIIIQKQEQKGRTLTSTKELDEQEKVQELAKMITGNELTTTALEHANQLVSLTADFKATS